MTKIRKVRQVPRSETTVQYHFVCPGCDQEHAFNTKTWKWNGDYDKPTLSPSYLIQGHRWDDKTKKHSSDFVCHSFIKDGKIRYLADCTHKLAGKTVDLLDINETTFDTKKYEFWNPASIVFVGDVHGRFREFGFKITNQHKLVNSVIFQCGDFGVGFLSKSYYDKELERLNKKLEKIGTIAFAIRGNHDDPSYFDGNYSFSNIKLVPDYSIVRIDDKKVLCVGGGISVDRIKRTIDADYWPLEIPEYEENKLDVSTITCVASHDAPDFCEPVTKENIEYWLKKDAGLNRLVTKSRDVLTKIFNKLIENKNPLKSWFYGHHHSSFVQENKGINFNMLDILEFKELK